MKRILILLGLIVIISAQEVRADEIEVYHATATAYCLKGITAAGTVPTEGRTVASKKEWLGSTMIMWKDDGDGLIKPQNYLGTFVVEDTGNENIKDIGSVIDVYISDYDEAIEFGSKKIVFQIVEAEG